MSSQRLVRDYFDREAKRFDAIYVDDKPIHQRVVDSLFRKVVVERFHLVCNLAPSPGRWTVLDVGCGPGRYGIALARAGAAKVVGVDVAQTMIDLARHEAEQAGVVDQFEFVTSSFQGYDSKERFDVALAMGYFDYLEDPLADLRKMVEQCKGRIFASFPKRWEFRVPIRKTRFLLAGGFVRFYGKNEVRKLFREAGVPDERLSLVDLGRDWIAIANVG